MDDPRLKRTRLGYLEVVNKPTSEELNSYYSNKYYQEAMGSYEKSYSNEELKYIKLKIKQHSYLIEQLTKKTKGKLLDVGCGEGFTLKYYVEKQWQVKGIDFSRAGLEQQNPDMLDYVDIGNFYEILSQYQGNNNQYDIIWLNNVLEHVLDPVNLLIDLKMGNKNFLIIIPLLKSTHHPRNKKPR